MCEEVLVLTFSQLFRQGLRGYLLMQFKKYER